MMKDIGPGIDGGCRHLPVMVALSTPPRTISQGLALAAAAVCVYVCIYIYTCVSEGVYLPPYDCVAVSQTLSRQWQRRMGQCTSAQGNRLPPQIFRVGFALCCCRRRIL